MSRKLNKLTKKDINQIPVYYQKWLDILLDTKPVTQKQADEFGKKWMARICCPYTETVLVNDPIEAWHLVNKMLLFDTSIGKHDIINSNVIKLFNELLPKIDKSICAELDSELFYDIKFKLNISELGLIGSTYFNLIHNYVEGVMYDTLTYLAAFNFYRPRMSKFNLIANCAAFDYCESVFDVDMEWSLLRDACQFHICIAIAGTVYIVNNPIKFPQDHRTLHCDDGPLMEYRSGLKFWAINGVFVDEQIVMRPETQTIKQIMEERNEEVKRIRIERYGWMRYLTKLNAKCIDSRRNDIDGTNEALYHCNNQKVLVCACPSTGKVFSLEVPLHTRLCEDAQLFLSSGLSSRIISAS